MYLDALTLTALADELREQLVGGRVQAIVPADALTLVFEIYRGRRHYLLLSANPQTPRAHLDQKGRRGVERETPFLLMLRKFIRGSRVIAVSVPDWERILDFEFEGEEGRFHLVAELMGRLSNLILVDAEGIVRDSARRITPEMTRARVVLPRQPYVPPPPLDRPAPDALTQPYLETLLASATTDRPLWRVLTGGLRGISPLAAREAVYRAVGDPEATVGAVDRLAPLVTAVTSLAAPARHDDRRWTADDRPQTADDRPQTPEDKPSSIVHRSSSSWEPSVAREDEAVIAFAPYQLTHLPDWEPTPSLSEAIADYFAAQVGRDAYAAARGRVHVLIETAREKAQRQQAALQREIVSPEDIEQRRVMGDWLLAYAWSVQPGATELKIDDTGDGPLVIPLDPKLSAVENAQRLFRDYERSKRAAADLADREASVNATVATLDQLLTDLQLAETRPEIDAVQAQFAALFGERTPAPPPRSAKPAPPHEAISPDGFTILIGRNSRQNDYVTFERAVSHDLWLHARGVPGAHVIIKTEGRTVPETTIATAASLAAYYSSARGSTNVAVDVTEARRVRHLKGGGPGLVTITGERTVHAEPTKLDD